jgi:hypothetical protein
MFGMYLVCGGVLCHSMSWIHGGSMKVLHDDMAVIQDTIRGGLYEMVGTIESTSTIVPICTPT